MNVWNENVDLDFGANSYPPLYNIAQYLIQWAHNLKKAWEVMLDSLMEKFHR